jgi:N-acyl-D-amino-acid deacylase
MSAATHHPGFPMPHLMVTTVRGLRAALACATLAVAAPTSAQSSAPAAGYDLVIRNGRLLDGAGNPWIRADVAITGDRVVAIGDLASAQARRVIDAAGRYVAPGFIDTHSHAGPGLASPALSAAAPLLAEGITTVVVNPDGGGSVDLVQQRARLVAARPASTSA